MHPFIQVAFDGDWSRAPSSRGADGLATLQAQLTAHRGEFAVEVFFPVSREQPLLAPFLGVRLSAGAPGGAAALVARLHASLASPHGVIGSLRDAIDTRLFTRPPVRAEVGVVNDWSATAVPLARWDAGEWIDRADVAPKLRARTAQPVALEVAIESPIPHWWALPVSAQVPGGYRFEPEMARHAVVRLAASPTADALSDPR